MKLQEVSVFAKEMAKELTGVEVDAVSLCQRAGTDWVVEVDVVESAARMGDDDLLTAYRLEITDEGELVAFRRIGRHKRTDAVSAA